MLLRLALHYQVKLTPNTNKAMSGRSCYEQQE